MPRPFQLKRALLLLGLVALSFAGLGYRLVDLQVLRHAELSALAQDNTQREYLSAPRRGDILDIHGNLLATSVPVKRICANPSLIGDKKADVARALAPLLQMTEADLYQRLCPRVYQATNGDMATNGLFYVRLRENVPEEMWAKIQSTMQNLSFGLDETKLSRSDRNDLRNLRKYAISAEADQMRIFPNGPLAAHVLGYDGKQEYRVNGQLISQIVGRDGIEFAMNQALSGVAGWRVTETDRKQRELVALRDEDVQPTDGLNVVLTIDAAIQHIVEVALADAAKKHTPQSITGIVMRPSTGEILAMATLPNYDPNNLATLNTNTIRNRVITDAIEPGSVFKIVVVSGALNEHTLKLSDTFYCEEGHFAFGGRILHDHEKLGMETAESIITKSSNIGAAKIAIERLGPERLYNYASQYGFGEKTGIPLPYESRGILYPVDKWSKVTIAQMPMGHGVAVTRLQMLMAMAAVANHGVLMRPMLVSRLQDRSGNIVQQYQPQRVRQVVSESADAQMIEALKTVVTKDGTAPGADMDHYTVAGKTGTAQKVINGTYAEHKFNSTFIGFFPADNPQLCISIVMDDPKDGYYGGQACGPVFKDIAERCASYLNIPPDKNLQPPNSVNSIVATAQTR